jgi:hypothetical protein
LWHLQKFWQYIKYIKLEFTPPPFSFIPPSPIPRIVSTSLIFPSIYMCTQYLHHIHLPTPFPHTLPPPLVPTPQIGSDYRFLKIASLWKSVGNGIMNSAPGQQISDAICHSTICEPHE